MHKEYAYVECYCPVESLTNTISATISSRESMGYELLNYQTYITGDSSSVIFSFIVMKHDMQ